MTRLRNRVPRQKPGCTALGASEFESGNGATALDRGLDDRERAAGRVARATAASRRVRLAPPMALVSLVFSTPDIRAEPLDASTSREAANCLPVRTPAKSPRGTGFSTPETVAPEVLRRQSLQAKTENLPPQTARNGRKRGPLAYEFLHPGFERLDGGVPSHMRTGLANQLLLIPVILIFFRDKMPVFFCLQLHALCFSA